jgi:N-ethylmaleimide reductase
LFISNPDLVERFENNLELAEWDEDTFYTTGPK